MEPRRAPLHGGCHCGATRYVLFLTLPAPPPDPSSPPPGAGQQRFQRCNCTTCHKMGLFHVKPASAARDFLLLRPLDPYAALGDYLTDDKEIRFFFCRTCGVRCFSTNATGEVVGVEDAAALGLPARTRAWRAVEGSGAPEYGTFVSVNGHTVDADQTEFDMRELTEKRCVRYLDTFSEHGKGQPGRWDRPHDHGCY
ncbi:DUF636 domain-containing protein [Cordyceps fumosorosea ARSEF 2679]|uniref:DUF636 domain-containing protein n=1 Tax=Cordyceps fumosorosea (strain ARSEF 2679) TaxID=1081104 RepID=A0A167SZQ3_CORFA|nr:DUF636 domain-containing protein [Cordyceps fumosorosea ARSEF 2679]OAA60097.1 DUF636 domain-containing protein [Cordyceps fumosorosea ARSEF 2679]